MAIIP